MKPATIETYDVQIDQAYYRLETCAEARILAQKSYLRGISWRHMAWTFGRLGGKASESGPWYRQCLVNEQGEPL